MKYTVTVGDNTADVDVDPSGRVLVAGQVVAAEIVALATNVRRVSIEGAAYEVAILGRSPLRLSVDGVEVTVGLADARVLAAGIAGGAPAAAHSELRAPMPGLLKTVHVREGDIVEAGAAIVTLEAMKMENELRARGRSRVARVAVAAGTKVERDALLVVLEPVT